MDGRLRLLIIAALLGGFALFSWRGLGETFRERGRYTDALGLVPAAATPLAFPVPTMTELAARYNLSPQHATCALCHLGREGEKRLNPFGRDYQAVVQKTLNETVPADSPEARSIFQLNVAQVRRAVAEATRDGLDSDLDGYDNDLELLFGFLPGDPASRPGLSARVMRQYRARLREAGRDGRLEGLLRGPPAPEDPGAAGRFFGFAPGQTPLVRPERLALYRRALE